VRSITHVHAALVDVAISATILLGAIVVLVLVGAVPTSLTSAAPAAGDATLLAVTADPSAGQVLTTADLEAITTSVPGLRLVSRMLVATAPVSAAGPARQLGVEAVDPTYRLTPAARLASGGFFTVADALGANRVAVLDRQAASALFGGAAAPVGQTIRVGDVPFTVVGVLAGVERGQAASGGTVLVPFQTAQVRLVGQAPLSEGLLEVQDAGRAADVVPQVQRVLRARHRLAADSPAFRIGPAVNMDASAQAPAASSFLDRLASVSRSYACQVKGACAPPPA